jgi:hypothetical protein
MTFFLDPDALGADSIGSVVETLKGEALTVS